MNAAQSVTVRGEWPGLVTLRSGWWKAVARPVNDESPEAVLRAERSTADFVRRCAETLLDLGASGIHSPPLMRGTDRTFRAAGFTPHVELLLLERDLREEVAPWEGVRVATPADHDDAVAVDATAFEGDWRLGRLGLEDALTATADSTMLCLEEGGGFSIVGVSADIAYLQRIAVHPSRQGAGLGTLLLRASIAWARRRGARTMLLNTQLDNERATRMYRSEAFAVLPTRLTIFRYAP